MSPRDTPWSDLAGIVAEAEANRKMVVRGEVDVDKLYENRETDAAPTYRDRQRRAELYARWPSRVRTGVGGKRRT